ncbi:unnamed protein product [Sphenostylis stenocarpa]|uniref:Uncharacterized protein n=1 Tax=Sphenostylis stenocarpa TaxID=92480 RepID=A0AA86VJZ7_9FABA|nr:unnamed protein product [Sphenostylis stenocarpa]
MTPRYLCMQNEKWKQGTVGRRDVTGNLSEEKEKRFVGGAGGPGLGPEEIRGALYSMAHHVGLWSVVPHLVLSALSLHPCHPHVGVMGKGYMVDPLFGAHADAEADIPNKALINASFVCTDGGGRVSWSN